MCRSLTRHTKTETDVASENALPDARTEPQPSTMVPYFSGAFDANEHDAYLVVRVVERVRPNGYVTAYLPDGTSLFVRAQYLFSLASRD